ncbi:MAG TPA: Crp/Fnr family transcriptional regulator [Anaerolineales bacterium]|nr:Crp/Fnr family transcriptional regulator [Anaerolineales bacterium]
MKDRRSAKRYVPQTSPRRRSSSARRDSNGANGAARDGRSATDRSILHPAFRDARILAGLTRDEIHEVARAFRPRTFTRGETLFHEGHRAATYYLIAKGQVKILQTTAEGFEVILHIFGEGELVGALPNLGEGTYPATAAALGDVEAFSISSGAFDSILERFPPIAVNMLRFAAGVIQHSHRRLREMATERVEQRIARTLVRLVRQMGVKTDEGILLTAPLSRQDLANLAGTTLFTVSRTLKAWERRGILRTGRGRLTILDPHGLIVIGEDLPKPSETS